MPLLCASRNAGGMIVSARLRPSASSRVQPNVCSACAFQVTMLPAASPCRRTRRARCRGSGARARRSRPAAPAPRGARSSAIATAIRLAVEMAKFCSSTVHVRAPPTCSAQSTPLTVVALAQRHVEHGADVLRDRDTSSRNSRVRGSVLRVVRRDDALAFERLEVRRELLAPQPRAGLVAGARRGGYRPTQSMALAARVEAPHADALDVAASRRRLRECRAADRRTCRSGRRSARSAPSARCSARRAAVRFPAARARRSAAR